MSQPRVQHITYATGRFLAAARLLARSAWRYGIRTTRIYGPADRVVADLAARHPDIMGAERGGGYWLWKPHIIRDALASANDGAVVLYTDAAMVFVADPGPLLGLAADHPVVLFEMEAMPMATWTKRDCFVGLGADILEFWQLNQLTAGVQMYRAGIESREFVDAVCAAMVRPGVLSDAENVRGKPNFKEYREHRHDQSILTIMARKYGLPAFPDPSQYGLKAPSLVPRPCDDGTVRPPAPYGQIFEIHRRKGRSFYRWYLKRLLANGIYKIARQD